MAAQGGMCQVEGPACGHYIIPNVVVETRPDLKMAKQIKDSKRLIQKKIIGLDGSLG